MWKHNTRHDWERERVGRDTICIWHYTWDWIVSFWHKHMHRHMHKHMHTQTECNNGVYCTLSLSFMDFHGCEGSGLHSRSFDLTTEFECMPMRFAVEQIAAHIPLLKDRHHCLWVLACFWSSELYGTGVIGSGILPTALLQFDLGYNGDCNKKLSTLNSSNWEDHEGSCRTVILATLRLLIKGTVSGPTAYHDQTSSSATQLII